MDSTCTLQWILDNYAALLQEWTISLDEKLQSNIRGRIIGCQAQMNTFDFFFGLNLGQRLFSHTDNLSRTLQQTKISALSGKRIACLTKDVLQKIHRGYYTVARRYKFYVRVARTISHECAQRTSEILFLPREHKIHIFEPTCNVLFIIWRRVFYWELNHS